MRSRQWSPMGVAALVIAAVVCLPLGAQPPENEAQSGRPGGFRLPPPPLLSALDANSDGEITADEIDNAVAALKKLDKNSDGELSIDEMMPFPGGFGGPGGPGGPGGGPMVHPRAEILARFDLNKDGILDAAERAEARKYLKENPPARGGPGGGFGGPGFGGPPPGFDMGFGGPPPGFDMGFGGPGFGGPPGFDMGFGGPGFGGPPGFDMGFGGPGGGGPGGGGPGGGGNREPAAPGKQLTPDDVASYPDRDLYDPEIVRTIFLWFENQDWEEELEDFRMTDVDVPAQMIVDGRTYVNVGVRFRGNTSYQMVPRGKKRSLNISVDYGQKGQRLYGRKTLNLLNAHSDPSLLREVLFSRIGREYLPALDANLVRVVINGESWGIYTNQEQFNKDFLRKWFGDANGARWKVPPNFSGGSGLMYLGDDLAPYKRNYLIKSSDNEADWRKLVALCRALEETPPDQREALFDKLMNVDEVLWFLAVDNVLSDEDGYFTRASDYTLYLDTHYDRFYVFAHDNNESLRSIEGPGMGGFFGGPGGPGGEHGQMGPLSQVGSANRPLLTALLTNPHWKARYLAHVRTIAEKWLDWNTVGPIFEQYRALIDEDVREDTKLSISYEQFAHSDISSDGQRGGPFGSAPGIKTFMTERREYLLSHPEINKPYPVIEAVTHRPMRDDVQQLSAEDSVVVEARIVGEPKPQIVLLYYASAPNAPFDQVEMHDDGQHHDQLAGDGIYGAVIDGAPGRCAVRYYVEARADASLGTTAFMPAGAEMGAFRYEVIATSESQSPVVINELMAANKRTVRDPQGQYDDWLEIYNRTERTVDISGMYLSDSKSNLRKWSFPPGTTIPARGTLVVWLDKDLRAIRGLHANFKLSKKGETVFLSDTDARGNVIRDQVSFGPLKEDVSLGRFPDGSARWTPMVPTPDGANRIRE